MSKVIYLPIEHIDTRYTIHLDRDITKHLEAYYPNFIKIYPDAKPSRPLPPGMFLDAPFSTKFKSLQLAELANLFETNQIEDGDIIFFGDIWFPGIESVAYMSHFCQKKVRIRGMLHAGSYTDTDEVRQLERWAKNFEDIIFDIADEIYVASEFSKNDVCRKRFVNPDKVRVTPDPLNVYELDMYTDKKSIQPIVIFNGRDHIEKQPHLWEKLQNKLIKRWDKLNPDNKCPFQFVWTQKENLKKSDYYSLLAKSSVVVSFALQENFGYGVAEAAYLGCIPVVPNRLVYPEFYKQECLYDTFDEAVDLVYAALTDYEKFMQPIKYQVFKLTSMTEGNMSSIKSWFI